MYACLYVTRIEQNSFLHDVQKAGCQSPQFIMTLGSKSSLFPSSCSLCTSAYLRLVAREGLAVLLSTPLSNASSWIWNVRYQCCCQPHVVHDWRSFPSRSLVDELQEPSLGVRFPVASQNHSNIFKSNNNTSSIQIQRQTLFDYDMDSYADVCEQNKTRTKSLRPPVYHTDPCFVIAVELNAIYTNRQKRSNSERR